jgi:hypothetical protein
MTSFKRGDIVIVDLGFAAKVRPCMVLSGPRPDRTRNLCVVSVHAPLLTITGPDVQKVLAAVSSASRDTVTDTNPFEFEFAVEFVEDTNCLGAIFSDGEWFWVYQGPWPNGFYYSGMYLLSVDRRQYRFKSDIVESLVFVPTHKEYNNKYRASLPK